MTYKFKLDVPDETMATMTITKSIKWWRNLGDVIGDKYPSWEFASEIRKMISEAERVFYKQGEPHDHP